MKQSPICKLRIKNCKIKKWQNGDSKNIFKMNASVGDNIRRKKKTGPPSNELRELAYLDRHDGMPGPHQVHSRGVRVVPNLLHLECCQILSTRPGKPVLTPRDSDPPCCPGSDELPTHWNRPTRSVVVGLWLCWGSH